MAGFILYSLDWPQVKQFMESPDEVRLLKLAQLVSDEMDQVDGELDDGDPVASWPADPVELAPVLAQRIALPDWYGDLSDSGKSAWEWGFSAFCSDDDVFAFEVESDGVYWNIHSEALKHHGLKDDVIGDMEITHFGTRPFRYRQQGKRSFDHYYPYHSMHTPDEVKKLVEQFSAAESTILSSRYEEVQDDYEELMPVLHRLVEANRVLYVSVDT